MKSPKFLISGGGTGGHIFPAIAIADELKRHFPKAEFLFIGAQNKMEMEKIPQAGYKIEGLWISGISRSSLITNLSFPFKIISSLYKAKKIIKKFKPDAAIGTGGFASGPALYMASKMQIPIFIQEQNSFPGITNKKLATLTKAIFVAYDKMDKFFPKEKIHITGNPVRNSLFENNLNKEEAKKKLNLDSEKLTILSIGGSQGSRNINNFWRENAIHISQKNIQIIWQTGSLDYNSIIKEEKLKNPDIHIVEFIKDMATAYVAADIIISRAGAIAISELCLAGKPTILIPFPYAAEDHQTKNAQELVEKKAAYMVKDFEIPNILSSKIEQLIQDEKLRSDLSNNILKLAKPKATEDIVNLIIKKLNLNNGK